MADFDVIVVGGGTAGAAVAARLSERPDLRVLLLEAGGPDDRPEIRVPALMASLFGGVEDWGYQTQPQPAAGGRRVRWPLGRTLGGSSSMNASIYIEGAELDFDEWRSLDRLEGWSYADLAPLFARVRRMLHIGPLGRKDPLTRAWVAAAQRTGLPAAGDFAGPATDGAGFFQVNHRRGRRWSTADGYLRPALSRPNLTVLTGALVTRIVIEAGRAAGVEYDVGGARHTATAAYEVVLAAGAVASPQVLLLSGVGPRRQLEALGIDVVADRRRVGQGLQDHPRVTAQWRMRGGPRRNLLALLRWRLFGTGPMASNGGEAGAFVRTRDGLGAPDLQFMTCPPSVLDAGDPVVSVLVTAVEVHSRGSVTLVSADPDAPPAIDPGYLTDPRDLDVLVAGVRTARGIAGAAPFADEVDAELSPGPAVTDDGLADWVRANVVTMHHPTSTCAMGADADAVCDSQLRVRGVEGLRVADASVMPRVPRGNTQAVTVAIAERAADLILASVAVSTAPTVKETA